MNKSNEFEWRNISWKTSTENVRKWQLLIYKASKEGNVKEVRRLQHIVLGLLDSKLLAVRQITQDNKGKNTPGVDGIASYKPEQRIGLAKSLKIYTPGKPLKRIWIPKPGTDEKRPLSIPTIRDRCLQALFKLALEPEWEAKFENDSYGFRPGRHCHDAVAAVRSRLFSEKFILDADISKCFDRIDHGYLLNKMGFKGKYRKQLKSWLKCGALDAGTRIETEEGTPQGGVISPLLANIALDGMERFCRESISHLPAYNAKGSPIKKNRRGETLGLVRYADDFVLIHPQLSTILFLEKELERFLTPIGLELSLKKTTLSHSRYEPRTVILDKDNLNDKAGFQFLGFYFCQYSSTHRSIKDKSGERLGFRLLVTPSKQKVNSYQQELHDLILKRGKKLTQDELISKLNPVISGWSSYFGVSDANTTGILVKMDYLLYLKLRKWANRVYKGAKAGTAAFNTIGTRKWVFSTGKSSVLEHHIYSRPISNYVKVQGEASVYDGKVSYWSKRLTSKYYGNPGISRLLSKQKFKCNLCGGNIEDFDLLEVDHIIPKVLGGSNSSKNLQLLHRHCHHYKSSTDNSRPVIQR